MVNCPVPGGVIVRGNTIRNFGRRGMMLGKAGQVADGCTTHLPNAIVQDNQLLGGGQRATLKDAYIQGILIYGHNVSVIGNIVRDVNRGKAVPGSLAVIVDEGKKSSASGLTLSAEASSSGWRGHYLKANRAWSGEYLHQFRWRSVIEIKTGGKEHLYRL